MRYVVAATEEETSCRASRRLDVEHRARLQIVADFDEVSSLG